MINDVKIIYDMPAAEYHAVAAVSKSLLGHFGRTAAHGKHALDNPKDTDALRFGRAFHVLSLEPHKLDAECAVAPECDRRTKEGKAIWNEFAKRSEGMHILKSEQYEQALAMAVAFRGSPEFAALGENLKYEVSIFWQDETTWERCKTRLDAVDELRGIIYDLKSVRDASEDGFARDAFAYDYHMGAAIHFDAYERAYGRPANLYVMPLVEKDAPHLVQWFEVAERDDFVMLGRRAFDERIRKYSSAKVSNKWEGYPTGLRKLQLPAWVQRKIEQGEM